MASGDTKTNQYLDIAANGSRADLPSDTCCETRSQTLIREVAERVMDVEDEVQRLENNPDVADIVATYADLQAYDTSQLTDKDVIRVLQDETHNDDSTYYRYSTASQTWTYIGESKQYTDFVGTDGTSAGEAGLVPAPATTDTDKYLKSDGTWSEVQGGSTPVQTMGNSTTDVMSQKATTGMVYVDETSRSKVGITNNVQRLSAGDGSVSIGNRALARAGFSVAIGEDAAGASGAGGAVAIGRSATASGNGAIALGARSSASSQGEMNIGTSLAGYGYKNTNFRVIRGVHDGENANDAVTVGQVNSVIDSINSALSTNIPHIGV